MVGSEDRKKKRGRGKGIRMNVEGKEGSKGEEVTEVLCNRSILTNPRTKQR